MIVPAPVNQKFQYIRPYVDIVASRVKDIIIAYCGQQGFPFVFRLKTSESVSEKIETGRFRKWSDLDDIFACAIIIPTLEYETSVVNFLQHEFEEVALRRRGSTQNDPTVFRFDSTRFIGRIKSSLTLELDENIRTTSFEVQVRSAFEHAWSVATHALAYKGQQIDWKVFRTGCKTHFPKYDINLRFKVFLYHLFHRKQSDRVAQAAEHLFYPLKYSSLFRIFLRVT